MADYLRPTSLEEALSALADRPWTMLAGGTDVYPTAVGRPFTDDVLDVTGLPSLRAITVADGVVRIPALATWTDVVRAELPPAFDGLKAAARSIGGVQIQNRGTLAGNLCNASPAADGLPNLMALHATVELSSAAGSREVPVGEFVTGNRRTVRRRDELVTAILVPAPTPSARSTFLKLGSRAYLVISIASVAAVLDVGADGVVASPRIVIGACSEVPMRIEAAEARLVGRSASPSLAGDIDAADLGALAPIDDVRGTAAYRRDVALTLVRRAVSELLG
jgi:CO/xanthine dehydrogenase FAD-binding subunit